MFRILAPGFLKITLLFYIKNNTILVDWRVFDNTRPQFFIIRVLLLLRFCVIIIYCAFN